MTTFDIILIGALAVYIAAAAIIARFVWTRSRQPAPVIPLNDPEHLTQIARREGRQ